MSSIIDKIKDIFDGDEDKKKAEQARVDAENTTTPVDGNTTEIINEDVQTTTVDAPVAPADETPVVEPAIVDAPVAEAPVTPEPVAAPPAPAAPAPRTYTVVDGDTLWGIAETHLGDGTRYQEIADLNGIANPDLINTGQVLTLPN